LCEHPALSKQGPDVCLRQIADGLKIATEKAGILATDVVAVGLDTPGPASAAGQLSARGSTNFVHPQWAGFDIRDGLAQALGKPVTYLNDANAAALWGTTQSSAQQPRDIRFDRDRHRQWRRHHP